MSEPSTVLLGTTPSLHGNPLLSLVPSPYFPFPFLLVEMHFPLNRCGNGNRDWARLSLTVLSTCPLPPKCGVDTHCFPHAVACANLDKGVELINKVVSSDAIYALIVVHQEGVAVVERLPVVNILAISHGLQGQDELLLVEPLLEVLTAGELVYDTLHA